MQLLVLIVDDVDTDLCVNFGDYRSNSSWNMQPAHFVMDDNGRNSWQSGILS